MGTLSSLIRWLSRIPIFHSLRFRLTLLVLLGALPAIGLLLLTASQQRDDAIAEGQEQANRLVRLAAVDQRRIFDQAQQLLTTVARLPEVQGENPEACSELMSELLEINSEFDNLGVVSRDGSVFCSGMEGDFSVLLNDEQFFEEAFAMNELVIGTYQVGPLSDEPTVTYAVPILGEDEDPQRILYGSLNLGALDTFANIANLPEGAVFSVYDRTGDLLLRSPGDESAIGRSFAQDPVVSRMITDRTGTTLLQYVDPDFIFSGEWIEIWSSEENVQGAAFITVALPKAAIVERANETFQENLSRLGLAALVAVALAWVGADLFMGRDSETRKSIVAGIYRVYETGNLQHLDDVIATDVVDRSPAPGQVQGLSGYKQLVGQFRSAFPNGTIQPDDLLVAEDMVVAHVTLSGTHVNEFFGLPPSGEPVVAKGVETFRFANGVIVEMSSLFTPLAVVKPSDESEVQNPPVQEPKRPNIFQRIIGIFRRKGSS